MLQGIISFSARIEGDGVQFARLVYDPDEALVDKVEIEGPDGQTIRCTVHLLAVPSEQAGLRLAKQVHALAMTRLAFHFGLAIQPSVITGELFLPLKARRGEVYVASRFSDSKAPERVVVRVVSAKVKSILQQAAPAGERHFGLLVSALRSSSAVEKFMHLYNIILMFHQDTQVKVEAFIGAENPSVPLTPSPSKPGVLETIYTRLRNELARARPGVDLERTKEEMEDYLRGLIELTRRAIELQA